MSHWKSRAKRKLLPFFGTRYLLEYKSKREGGSPHNRYLIETCLGLRALDDSIEQESHSCFDARTNSRNRAGAIYFLDVWQLACERTFGDAKFNAPFAFLLPTDAGTSSQIHHFQQVEGL